MKIRIEDCRLFACGLTLLCLFAADTAVAQRESTVNRDAEPEGQWPFRGLGATLGE